METNLKAIRQTLNVSIEALAAKSNISADRLKRLEEKGEHWALSHEKQALAKATGFDADMILKPYSREQVDAAILRLV